MSFTINLGVSKAEPELVDKTGYFSWSINATGDLLESTSIFKPSIKIECENPSSFNYAYISTFKRYYYIENITNIVDNIWQFDMKCDVLMSFNSSIREQTAIISKQESDPINKYYNDGTYKNEEKTFHKIIEFDDLFELGFGYIVTIVGGYPINEPT